MRKFSPLFLLVSVLFVLGARPASAAPAFVPDCATQNSNLAVSGRPLPDARLIGSSNPALNTPAPPPAAGSNTPAPVTHTVQAGEWLSAIARLYGVPVADILAANNILNPNLIYRGQVLVIPVPGSAPAPRPAASAAKLPEPFEEVWLIGDAWQGETATLWLKTTPGVRVSGTYGTQKVPFRAHCNLLWGMVAFDVFDAPGTQTIFLSATYPNGSIRTTALPINLRDVSYRSGPLIVYPSDRQELLNPETIRAENNRLYALFDSIRDAPPLWDRPFRKPVDNVITQGFGSTGTRNGVPVSYHEGVDLRAREPVPLYASSRGNVILAEPLTVRGLTVYIDHGAGVVTGYFHLSELHVRAGEWVEMGEQLGLTGNTGLSTAPHLHWEMRVNGRWVNPLPWLSRTP